MHPVKLSFFHEVVRTVNDLCQLAFDVRSEEDIEKILGQSKEKISQVIQQLINSLPDVFFLKASQGALNEIRDICAREFLFFQIQEKGNEDHYQDDLSSFTMIFTRDIQERIKATMDEEESSR